ncbi:MAG: hypothetical protein QNI99_21605 [Woeseiaceae bacterium]|nr:hypothetical protein [Woeseiaceae bacterium]
MPDPVNSDANVAPAIAMTADPVDTRSNYFLRLFRGDIPLVVTYWVWGILGNAVLSGISVAIESNYASVVTSTGGLSLVRYFYWGALAYAVFTWIAIWRSAGKYTGAGWGIVARVVVVLSVLANLYWLTIVADDDYSLQAEITMINQSLPVMVDDYTRLDSVEYETTRLSYYYTIVGTRRSDINVDFLRNFVRGSATETLCNDSLSAEVLETGIDYRYSYTDEYGAFIMELTITESDCR